MIYFEQLESNIESLSEQFLSAAPFEHLVIDNFCNEEKLRSALKAIPDPVDANVNRSRDFIFAKNKFEKADFDQLDDNLATVKGELLSERFAKLVSDIAKQDIFIDPSFHGGGLHQGGAGSFLNMHADFNYHPLNKSWFRNINILLYLNDNWQQSYGGELKLINKHDPQRKEYLIEPKFNRAVIMFTREHTLHGYDPIQFPEGMYRRSIAAYGYTKQAEEGIVRTTVWYPEDGGKVKKLLGKYMPHLIRFKSAILGSKTGNNK
ncbi:hypothetical protein JL49_20900 [Pseudoalteromonas luteoviolacea]|nr:hypothetical protein JL49_20900 [Pseudoalteromonas luteoviolacea]